MSYKTGLTSTWWLKHNAFKRYMLREATVLPLVFALCALLAGVWSLQNADQFAAWQQFMARPWVISLNVLAIVAGLYHAFTFFQLFPRVMPIRFGDRTVPAMVMVIGQWLAVLAVVVLMFWMFAGGLLGSLQ